MKSEFLGMYLLQKGLISADDLKKTLEYVETNNQSFEEIALSKGYLDKKQIIDAQKLQRYSGIPFIEIAKDKQYISDTQISEINTIMGNVNSQIYDVLLLLNIIDKESLEKEVQLFKKKEIMEQKKYKITMDQIDHGDIYREYVYELSKVFMNMLKLPVKFTAEGSLLTNEKNTLYQFAQKIVGLDNLFIFLILPQKMVIHLTSTLNKSYSNVIDSMSMDTCCEMLNIIVGNLCVNLSQKGKKFIAYPPEVIKNDYLNMKANLGMIQLLSTVSEMGVCILETDDSPT